mmetsp:Transcript_18655/g.38260  ORF Transcript_18655/g.38260 Transcript_18655/m.38260 type:complete len:205 (+) Transcript_18655:59-673(+)
MNHSRIFQRNSFSSAIVAALFFSQAPCPLRGVDALASFDDEAVHCLPEAPKICVRGHYFLSPVPTMPTLEACKESKDDCKTIYLGGYERKYNYVNGDPSVLVQIEDDRATCTVHVGTEQCTSCSASCDGTPVEGGLMINQISYDCTNIENGATSAGMCEPMGKVFYPFVIEEATGLSSSNSILPKKMFSGASLLTITLVAFGTL